DSELCNACGRCVRRCQMDAVGLTGTATAQVDLDRCIGCGLCVTTCPTGSLSLVSTKKRTIPPRNAAFMYAKMYLERRGLLGAALIGVKYLLGRKI
ncbi:MAG: 4Fe-4S binding protein, partial [Spirochaetales bacterium]|nr:4Fe-4S binding protein [Spirochaetales bacterium]